jgi:hypothetical protein
MGIPRRLRDFYIKLAPHGEGYRSYVQQSPVGQGEGPFTPPVKRAELWALRRELSATIPASSGQRDVQARSRPVVTYPPKDIGERLGNGLFIDDVERLHVGSLGAIQSKDQEGLRLSIHLNLSDPDVSWLGQLPWELIRDKHHDLLLDPKISLARCLDLPGPPSPARVKPPFKILVVLASPKNLPPVDGKSEFQELVKSLSNSPSVQVSLLERATPEALGEQVQEETFHVVHFVGHAAFDSKSGKGRLLLEDADGLPNPVSAEELANLLNGQAKPRLLVLNACETAAFSWRDGHDSWSGLASALLRAGFPAVVAMQFPITDKAAVAFSRGFYGPLAAGHPVDLAITGGRRAIFLANPHSLEWATPVLFLRGMEGDLFRIRVPGPRQQSVVVEAKHQDIPQYEDQLINALAESLEIAPSDLESTGAEKGGRYKIILPAEAAKRLLEVAKSSEFSRSQVAFYVASIQTTWTLNWTSAAITFFLGILGNLIASMLQEGPLHGSFTLPRIALLLFLAFVFIRWDLFARIQEKLGSSRVIATLVACTTLLAMFALPVSLVPLPPDCDISRVELDLPNPVALNLSGNLITDVSEQELQGMQRLSGRAVLSEPGAHSRCEWRGKTDRDQSLSDLGSSADCDFTIDLPSQYDWIFLRLNVGDKTYLFTIHVH